MKSSQILLGVIIGSIVLIVTPSIVFKTNDMFQQPMKIFSDIPESQSISQNPTLLKGPYTQQAQKNSIIIFWETNEPTTLNEVHWGLTTNLGNSTEEQQPDAHTIHMVTIESLAASTQYYYKVISDDMQSNTYTFHTSFQQNDELQFVVYGDSRGNWDTWTSAKNVAHAIEATHPPFVITTGDLVDDGTIAGNWDYFFTASSFLHNSTLYPAIGNHERYGKWYFTYFSLPHNELWYSFDNGPVHFIGLDSNSKNAYRLIQRIWLVLDLRTNNQPFTIVYFHHPLYSSGSHGNTTFLRMIWNPIFEAYNVDIVFNGHDHDYERSVVNNIIYVVTGGGGAPLYNVGRSPWTIHSEKTNHYCFLTATLSSLTYQAIKPDGTVFDTFVISK